MTQELSFAPCVIELPTSSSPADLDIHLTNLDADLIRATSAVVFRTTESFISALSAPQARPSRESAAARVKNKDLFLVTYAIEERIHKVFSLTGKCITPLSDPEPMLSAVRDKELRSLIDRNERFCLTKGNERYHFVTPSRRHCSMFLRVGDCMRTARDVDCVAFWLLPHVARAGAVLVDSPTILAPVLRALHTLRSEAPVESLPIHPRYDKILASRTLESFSKRCGSNSQILCLISVSSSGFLADFIGHALSSAREQGTLQIISLFSFSNSPQSTATLCRLSLLAENYSAATCKLCSRTCIAISVDPSLYYIRDSMEVGITIAPRHFRESKTFLDQFGEIGGVLRVHHSDPNDSRHHAFNLDVKTLLEFDRFGRLCAEQLQTIRPKPDIVVIPNHPAGNVLKKIAGEALNVPVLNANDLTPTHLNASDVEMLRTAHHIFVADDVLNSGSRLLKFNAALRENYTPFASVNFFVGVARPQSKAELLENERAITSNHPWKGTLTYSSLVYLPRWKEDECPWCDEYDWLSRISRTFAISPSWIRDRVGELVESELKLAQQPLLLLPGVSARTLGGGSPTGPKGSSAIRMLFSFASALQEIRANIPETERLDTRFPLRRTFSAKNLKNYSEGLLHAVLLRVVRPLEWGIEQRELAAEKLHDFARQSDHDIFLGELMLAMQRDATPAVDPGKYAELFALRLGAHLDVFAKATSLPLRGLQPQQ